jgi:four helix bundle protein
VAEGSGHRSRKGFARFVTYSIASSCELENQLKLARDLKAISYAEGEKLGEEVSEIRRMLRGFLRRLEE